MKYLKMLMEKIILTLSPSRKAQLLDLTFAHVAEVAYFRLAKNGFRPNGIIDIGAYHGVWSRFIAPVFPKVPILMIEAQAEKKAQLESVCIELPQTKFELALLGKQDNAEADFYLMETGSSLYYERSDALRTHRKLRMLTLDGILQQHPELKAPLLLKLDVQGAEIDVLTGGGWALGMAEVVQLEIALMNYNEGAPDMVDVVNFMAKHDLLFFDIAGFVKPDGKHLSQIDVLFVHKDSLLRKNYFVF